ncbi:hypothetical protein OEZ86_011884 [Tetradesmus obliquus]|nr:hypothetical protein OEZ86_011884 [Tetradesmus obliquus]
MPKLDIVCLGVGAGATAVYDLDGGCSSSFLLRVDAVPVLLLDVGLGVVRAALSCAGSLPDHVYISHNHTDHAGELPVLLAVESQRGRRLSVLAEPSVLNTLRSHRLHELQSTGRQLHEFGCFTACAAGQLHELGGGLALLPLKSRHAERCFGLLLFWQGQPLLGWSADSGYDAALYTALSVAPVLLLDGRPKGTSEHAGFAQLAAAASSGLFGSSKVHVYGYGTAGDAPDAAH